MRYDTKTEQLEGLEAFAESRGLNVETLLWAGIYVATEDDPAVSVDVTGWYAIPYPNLHGVWKTRYRNPDPDDRPKYMDQSGSDTHLYNPGRLGPGTPEVWICEGEFNALVLADLGIPAVATAGTGNALNSGKEEDKKAKPEVFRKSWALLFDDAQVVVAFDNDDEGRKVGNFLARAMSAEVFITDEEYNDINDWYLDDPDALASAIADFRSGVLGLDRLGQNER